MTQSLANKKQSTQQPHSSCSPSTKAPACQLQRKAISHFSTLDPAGQIPPAGVLLPLTNTLHAILVLLMATQASESVFKETVTIPFKWSRDLEMLFLTS